MESLNSMIKQAKLFDVTPPKNTADENPIDSPIYSFKFARNS